MQVELHCRLVLLVRSQKLSCQAGSWC